MIHFLVRWGINALSIFIVAHIVKGIEVSSAPIVLVIALVLGIKREAMGRGSICIGLDNYA